MHSIKKSDDSISPECNEIPARLERPGEKAAVDFAPMAALLCYHRPHSLLLQSSGASCPTQSYKKVRGKKLVGYAARKKSS